MNKNLCKYGCGQEGIKQYNDGSWCCSNHYNQCPVLRKKNSESQKGRIKLPETIERQRKTLSEGYKSGRIKLNKGIFKPGDEAWNKGIRMGPLLEETKRKMSNTLKGHIITKETKDKIGKANYIGDKGIDIGHNHVKVWNLFGKDHCEICGISLKDYQIKHPRGSRFSMHCRDKNYNNFDEDNWITVCEFGCHQKLDKLDRSI
jgi:hypothetical protein